MGGNPELLCRVSVGAEGWRRYGHHPQGVCSLRAQGRCHLEVEPGTGEHGEGTVLTGLGSLSPKSFLPSPAPPPALRPAPTGPHSSKPGSSLRLTAPLQSAFHTAGRTVCSTVFLSSLLSLDPSAAPCCLRRQTSSLARPPQRPAPPTSPALPPLPAAPRSAVLCATLRTHPQALF